METNGEGKRGSGRRLLLQGGVAVVLAGLGWGACRFRESSAMGQPVRAQREPGSAAAPIRSGGMDLLEVVDLRKDVVAGVWRFDGRVLVTASSNYGRLEFPCVPPEEYDLEFQVVRQSGNDSFDVGLVRQDRQFLCVIDGGQCTGLEYVEGKSFGENPTSLKGTQLPPGRPMKLAFEVRKERVRLRVTDREVIDWPARYEVLSLHENWRVSRKDTLFVGTWNTTFEVHEAVLTPRGGGGVKALRTADAATPQK